VLRHSTDRIYISRTVIFDKKVFPFAAHQSTVGTQCTSDVLLLPESVLRNNSSTNIDISPARSFLPVIGSSVQTQVFDMVSPASTGALLALHRLRHTSALRPLLCPGRPLCLIRIISLLLRQETCWILPMRQDMCLIKKQETCCVLLLRWVLCMLQHHVRPMLLVRQATCHIFIIVEYCSWSCASV
jgi:hypothetical protein